MSSEEARRRSSAETLELWREYADTRDTRVRDRLVLRLTPLVRFIATRQIKRLPGHLELDDFLSCGFEALIRSIDRFDPDRGSTLEQFVWTRISGAMLDELRQGDWAPRSLRRWERETNAARQRLSVEHGSAPSRGALAEAIGLTEAELDGRRAELVRAEVGSLNRQVDSDDETPVEVIDTLATRDRDTDPEDAAARRDAYDRLAAAVRRLPERDQRVVLMRYVEERPLREIGEALNITESRVCQLLGAARTKLHSQLERDADCLLEAA
jgi:RNA polymerase sigma factor for flagellar operon FliA